MYAKKARSASDTDVVFLFQEPDLPYKFHSVDELWQCNICDFMDLRFRRSNKATQGGLNLPLGPPDPRVIKPIAGDGNCFFRSVSYIVTGSELQHMDVRRVIFTTGNLLITTQLVTPVQNSTSKQREWTSLELGIQTQK